MKQLTPYDFFALGLIEQEPGISIRRLHTRINALLEYRAIPSEYAVPKANKASMEVCLERLRAAGLIEPHLQIASPEARALWAWIGRDWHHWPWYIPITNGHPDYEQLKERT